MRCAYDDTGITAVTFLAARSIALTVPTWTFDVYARLPSRVSTSMCDSGWPVGIRSTIRFDFGSITVIVFVISVVT